MRTPQEILSDLAAAGLPAAVMALIAELALSSSLLRQSADSPPTNPVTTSHDTVSERRRAYDRERQRLRRQSADSPPTSSENPPTSADIRRQSADSRVFLPSFLSSSDSQIPETEGRKEDARESADSPPTNPVTRTTVAFDQFWAIYPNKVGKGAALASFLKANKRVATDELMAGLRRYVAKTDDRPWCNPATWLNQDRWTDQPAKIAPHTNGYHNGTNGNRTYPNAGQPQTHGDKVLAGLAASYAKRQQRREQDRGGTIPNGDLLAIEHDPISAAGGDDASLRGRR